MTRRRRTLLIGYAVLFALVILAGVGMTAKLDSILNRSKEAYLPELAHRLGRPVQVGKISTTLWSGFGVTVDDVTIGADPSTPKDQLALLSVGRVRLRVSLLRALFSLGRTVRVTGLRIERPLVNLVRLPDGRLNLDVLADHLAQTASPTPTEPLDPRLRAMIEHARVDEARLTAGRVRFVDLKELQPTVEIAALELGLTGVAIDSPFDLALSCGLLSPSKNLELHARFGAAHHLDQLPPPLEELKLDLTRTDLGPLAPFLARAVAGLEAATASAHLEGKLGALAPHGSGPAELKGGVALAAVRFAGGQPFDAGLDADVAMQGADLDIRKLRLSLADMALFGQGRLQALATNPRFQRFTLTTQGLDFDRLRLFYPRLDKQAGATLHGPARFELVASGDASAQTFSLDLDLTSTGITVPRLFGKPAGTPLSMRARGQLAGDSLNLTTLSLILADLDVRGGGTVRHFAKPAIDLRADAQLNDLAGLLRLLPGVASALPPQATVKGQLSLHAQAKGALEALTAHGELTLAGVNFKTASARLIGGGHLTADASRQGQTTTLHVDADLGSLEAFYEDLLHKPRAMPLALKLDARQEGARLTPRLDLKIATTHVQADGALGPTDSDLRVRLEPLDVSTLTALLPGLARSGLPPIRLEATAQVSGRADEPEGLRTTVSNFSLTSRKSDLAGDLTVRGLTRPQIELHARSRFLDTDDLLPRAAGPSEPAAPSKSTAPSPLSTVSGHAVVQVARGVASKVPFEQLRADLTLKDGRVVAKDLEVGAWGGHFSGSGSEFDLVDAHGPFRLVGKVTGLDVAQLLARAGDSHDLLRGQLSASVDTRGRGTSVADLQKTLAGTLAGTVVGAQLVGTSLGGAIASRLAAALPMVKKPAQLLNGTNLRTLAGQVQFAAGAMNLQKPLRADTPEGPLSLTGRIFLDGRIDLTGTLQLSAAAASSLLGGRVHPKGPVPLSLRLGGELRHPTLQLANLSDVAKLLGGALGADALKQGAGAILKKSGLGNQLPGLDPAKLPTSQAEAQAKAAAAQKAAEEQAKAVQRAAEERAKAAQKAAEERARREAAEAKRRLQEEAKKKLKGLFGH